MSTVGSAEPEDLRPLGPPPGPTTDPPATRFGASMLRRFGWLYHLLGLGHWLGRIRLPDRSVERIREAADHGGIVYVLPTASTLDVLALNTVLNQRRLPVADWAEGFTSFPWQPVVPAWSDVWRRLRAVFQRGFPVDPVRSGWLGRLAGRGGAVLITLDERERRWPWRSADPDPLPGLIEASQRAAKPIVAVPLMVVWDRGPDKSGLGRFFLGARQAPSLLRRLYLVVQASDPFVHVGPPIDVARLAERFDTDRRTTALRKVMQRAHRRESKLVRGPQLMPHRTMRRLVLETPPMRDLARREAEATGTSVEAVQTELVAIYERIAARFSWAYIRVLHVFLRPLWTRVFSGVDVREEDLDRLRAAMRDGAPVLVPCHKSHFDYILMSWVCYDNDLIVPHVVAGDNLAIWPVSVILRGVGGFFIKRRFTGERLFPAVFSRYLRELLRQEYPVEFFIEGGRTRSGKLMPPRLGVLDMVLDAAAIRPAHREVTLLPVALAYEQVAEEGVYARELSGEQKRPETVGQLVKARSVLSRRFGRVYLRIGEPIRCGDVVDAGHDRPAWSDRAPAQRRDELARVGERLMHRIGQVTVVLPTSLVALGLLGHHRRAILDSELRARIQRMRDLLARRGALEAASLKQLDEAVASALDRFVHAGRIEAHSHEGQRLWAVRPAERITLEFYKNQVLHYLAPAGLAACSLRAQPGPIDIDGALPTFVHLLWLWRREFIWDPDASARAALAQGVADLEAHGAIEVREDGRVHVVQPALIGEVYGLFRSLIESYGVVLQTSDWLPITREAWIAALQADEAGLLQRGAVSRPEALSLVSLKNAIDTLVEDGTMDRDEHGMLTMNADRAGVHLTVLDRMVTS